MRKKKGEKMKFMILNSSGNVGKSTIARELIYPRLNDALIIEVETVNKSTKDYPFFKDKVYKFEAGNNFDELYLKIVENENLIVDVGASQLGEFWRQLAGYAGVEQLFDYFIVPTVAKDKQMEDTAKTIAFLQSVGIEDEKIKVIFNEVTRSVDNDFSALLNTKAIDYEFDKDLAIARSSAFKDLGLLKKVLFEVYNPDLDYYKNMILSAKEPKDKLKYVKMDLINRQAKKLIEQMDFIFEKITGEDGILKVEVDTQNGKKEEVRKDKRQEAKVVEEETIDANDDDL